MNKWGLAAGILILTMAVHAPARSDEDAIMLDELIVLGEVEDMLGEAQAASHGKALKSDVDARPYLRAGEVLELVPGMIVTQHSGTGKANQYFLRGFNLDHGTDFGAWVDGVPVNLPTHGHGQGYLDMNFVIPELIEFVEYKKGPYYAELGDFTSAGAAEVQLVNRLPQAFIKYGLGEDYYNRVVYANSPQVGDGALLHAIEAQYYDGPWDEPEHLGKVNALLKYTVEDDDGGLTLGATGYHSDWDAADQIPLRAVEQGLIGRLGTLDKTDGGRTTRVGAYGNWWRDGSLGRTSIDAYLTYYRLNLWSNFTFFLDDPDNGDQFEQVDDRVYGGFHAAQSWDQSLGSLPMTHTVGLQLRHDAISDVGLHHTRARSRLDTVRSDDVDQTSVGVYYRNETAWHEKVKTILGLRGDAFHFDVDSDLAVNSGSESDEIFSPKISLVLGPWSDTEFYGNAGLGYHSNDARGATIMIDPASGEPADPVDPLVRSRGYEVGVRNSALPGVTTSLAAWYLKLESELLFVGDAGTTEAGRPSERYGVEWLTYYQPTSWLTFDLSLALTQARFDDDDPADEIPGAVERVIGAGAAVELDNGFFGSLRLRHFGPRPLTEDGSVESGSTTLLNGRVGYERERFLVALDVLNILDSDDHDIDYYYASRLPGEPDEGVEDVHFHPVEPRTFRAYVAWKF